MLQTDFEWTWVIPAWRRTSKRPHLMCEHPEYAPNMHDKRKLSTTAAALVGGVVGVVIVWLSRPDAPSCTTLDNGMRACMPIHVVDPPLWLYGVSTVIGALLACGVACGFALARRARSATRVLS